MRKLLRRTCQDLPGLDETIDGLQRFDKNSMKDYSWRMSIYAHIMWKIEMSILKPTPKDELEFPDAMHDSENVVLAINDEDTDSDLDSCDNVDKCNVGDG